MLWIVEAERGLSVRWETFSRRPLYQTCTSETEIALIGRRSMTGEPLANLELIQALMLARNARRIAGLLDVILEHVRGHYGYRLNGWADERAVRAFEHAEEGADPVKQRHTRSVGNTRCHVSIVCDRQSARSPTENWSALRNGVAGPRRC